MKLPVFFKPLKNDTLVILLISIPFMVYYTLSSPSNQLPWVDEVMFTDTASNFSRDAQWSTTAWYAGGNQTPFSTYPPIYQILLALWFRLFGFSIWIGRSMNILIGFLVLYTINKTVKKFNIDVSILSWSTITFFFWTITNFSGLFFNGRPDILTALCSLILFGKILEFIANDLPLKKNISIVVFSAILLWSGIQSVVYVAFLICMLYFLIRSKRHVIFQIGVRYVIGVCLGIVLLALFMFMNNHLFAFIVSLVSYSSTLKSIAALLLPFLGSYLGINTQSWLDKLKDDATNEGIFERISNTYLDNIPYFVILILIIFLYYRIQNEYKQVIKKMLIILVLVPIFMNLAGRFASYYCWMVYLPLIVIIIISLESLNIKPKLLLCSTIFFVSIFDFVNLVASPKYNYTKIVEGIKKTHIKSTDNVVSSFSVFYEIKKKTKNAFFIGVFPINRLARKINYIVFYDSQGHDNVFMSRYVRENLIKGKLSLINKKDRSRLKIYKVLE